MPSYGKLVRDRIPDIIRRNGETPIFKALSRKEFRHSLAEKLVEECEELAQATDRLEMLLETADVKEVLSALCREYIVPFHLTLSHDRPYDPDIRNELLHGARAVRNATERSAALSVFLEKFSKLLDGLCFCREEVERKQAHRCGERGAFEKRFYLIKVISPGSIG